MSGVSLDHFLGGEGRLTATSPDVPPVQEIPPTSELVWPSRIKHLSATSIGMFRRCPEQFRHRYILGEKERPGEALLIGSALHEGLEFNYGQKLTSFEDRPTAEVVEYLQDVGVPKVLEENGGEDNIAWDADAAKGVKLLRSDSERMLIRYHEDVVPRIQPIGLEEKFFLHDERLPVPVIGYVDVRAGSLVQEPDDPNAEIWVPDRIVDTKTGKQSATKLKPSWMLQATIYSAMTNLLVEYHSISRAKTPKVVTALESDEMLFRPDPVKSENVIQSAATIGHMIAWMYTTLGPDQTWPTMGRFADWSMSFSPCTNCGWRKVCPAMAGEFVD